MNNLNQNNKLSIINSCLGLFSGLTQSDGSFGISFRKTTSKVGIVLMPFFRIELTKSSLPLILEIKNFFGCGRIGFNTNLNSISFEVSDFSSLWHIIIPYFIMNPLEGAKKAVFLKFIICMSLLYPYQNKNKPIWLLKLVIKIACLMNEGTRRTNTDLDYWLNHLNNIENNNIKESKLSDEVINEKLNNIIKNINTQFLLPNTELNLFFIIGAIIGDGSFFVSFSKNRKYRFGFNITTDIKDYYTLLKIKTRLNCGRLYIKSNSWCRFETESVNDLNNIIIPLIESLKNYYPDKNNYYLNLLGSKSKNYIAFKEALELHNNNLTKTDGGFKQLVLKTYNIHDDGKKRKYTMTEYLAQNNIF